MTELAGTAPASIEGGRRPSLRDLVGAAEIDLRLMGIVAALVAIILVFGALTGGQMLEPVNIVALSVQTASVAIIATGMVLVIVSRNIDLSVGSIVGVVSMVYALLMTDLLPKVLGFDNPFSWLIALALGLVVGAAFGAAQGFIIAYIGVPSFIVTLGGLLAFRGVVWQLSQGASISGLDPVFQLLGGGPEGSLGGLLSWLVAAAVCLAIIGYLVYNRRQRRKFGFKLRPMWAEVLVGVVGCGVVIGLVAYANAYLWPEGPGQPLGPGPRGSRPARWHPVGHPVPDRHPAGRDRPDDVHRHASPVRPVRVRVRREPRRGRAGRHQHPLDDPEDVHADGRPVRHRRRHLGRPAQRVHP